MEPQTPARTARLAFNAGVHGVEKGDELTLTRRGKPMRRTAEDRGQGATAPMPLRSKIHAGHRAHPTMYEAWNYMGYTQRMLGHYDEALIAYDHALNLKPGYPEAIEYRGHATWA
jgi:tetratricopeptide (TPR) repeat protein